VTGQCASSNLRTRRYGFIVIDGPGGFTKTWAFDQDDQRLILVRDAIDRGLREAGH
jgi:hypothetical protein